MRNAASALLVFFKKCIKGIQMSKEGSLYTFIHAIAKCTYLAGEERTSGLLVHIFEILVLCVFRIPILNQHQQTLHVKARRSFQKWGYVKVGRVIFVSDTVVPSPNNSPRLLPVVSALLPGHRPWAIELRSSRHNLSFF